MTLFSVAVLAAVAVVSWQLALEPLFFRFDQIDWARTFVFCWAGRPAHRCRNLDGRNGRRRDYGQRLGIDSCRRDGGRRDLVPTQEASSTLGEGLATLGGFYFCEVRDLISEEFELLLPVVI